MSYYIYLKVKYKTQDKTNKHYIDNIWWFKVKMPQFLVEDVIAETCDETAIMGEWNLKKTFGMKMKWIS